ncbi:MAG TPA: hypothetical protein VEU94_00200, partial [Terriglobales bacterium]|nr:hypothetical protein [Terriglobales bacterium]
MRLVPLELESKLREKGLWPESRTARAGVYVLALDMVFFAVQILTSHLFPKIASSLGGWVSFLSGLSIVLFVIVGFRWVRSQMLWRLRNRLIVTYIFIGVIPVLLLVIISFITLYLLGGQFASYVVTSEIASHLRSIEAENRAISTELATQFDSGQKPTADTIAGMRSRDADWSRRQVCAWRGIQLPPKCSGPAGTIPFDFPSFLKEDFREIVRDHNALFLRAASIVKTKSEPVYVISSEPLNQALMVEIATNLGEITLYETVQRSTGQRGNSQLPPAEEQKKPADSRDLTQTFTAGTVPPSDNLLDREITFGTPLSVVDWAGSTGERQQAGALVRVQTRPSILYGRLFEALGDLARGVE